jgi:peptidoglycan/LPS O-acetylase OafA/YrhL
LSSLRDNNFDLVRLLAAAQVAVVHICEHLRIGSPMLLRVLDLFPGVPIFFFVSGFLVSQSLARAKGLGGFYRNRVLRVFPGLWFCLLFSICLAAIFTDIPWTSASFYIWLLAQLSIGQFYNPPFLRDFGVGVLNGSLWTIPVELQFYLVLPVLYFLWKRWRRGAEAAFVIAAFAAHTFFILAIYGQGTLFAKLAQVTVVPWLFFFIMGSLAARHWPRVEHLFRGRFTYWLTGYVAGTLAIGYLSSLEISGNRINGISAILLLGVVLSAAYTAPALSRRLLAGNDISYGFYLYHMPLLNAYMVVGAARSPGGGALVFAVSVFVAVLSWRLVERPALAMKGANRSGQFAGAESRRS